MNRKTIYAILIAALVLILGGGAWWLYRESVKPAPIDGQIELSGDTTKEIDEALNDIDIGEVDAELTDIDKAIEEL